MPQSNNYFVRFIPSFSWILKIWKLDDEEIFSIGGLDAYVFIRFIMFSVRIFFIASILAALLLFPVTYSTLRERDDNVDNGSMDVLSIHSFTKGSRRLWIHCLVLYLINCFACVLLYFETMKIAVLRLEYIRESPTDPSQFTMLVRAIPRSPGESYSESVTNYFSKYHESTYLAHQMVHRCGRDQNPMECAVAFVFFKTCYATLCCSSILHSFDPMSWVTELAPEPHDVYWSSIRMTYKHIWIRKIVAFVVTILLTIAYILPVIFVQSLSLNKLEKIFPSMKELLEKKYVTQLVTGYLPSLILILFMYAVPPIMMRLSAAAGALSCSAIRKSACKKILIFKIWNVFFVNIITGYLILHYVSLHYNVIGIAEHLALDVPTQIDFFITYVLSSGWASLACEVINLSALLNKSMRFIFRMKDDSYSVTSFPYYKEVPHLLLFGFIGFALSILSPTILPFVCIFFMLAYMVYVNQILYIYFPKYETGGQFWPIIHSATIFSLLVSQIIALGVLLRKGMPVASGFIIPLIICTALFHYYSKRRFLWLFEKNVAEILIDMDMKDQLSGRIHEIHQLLPSAYGDNPSNPNPPGLIHPTLGRLPLPGIKPLIGWLSLLFSFQEMNQAHRLLILIWV
ncbi:CSC1-like protein RXW8 isoform X1 [Fagus crenata]